MKHLLFLILLALSLEGRAQLAEEWLRQNQTQRHYLAVQIAALRQYAALARRGYEAVNGGIRVVGQIKRGDLDIHSVFLSSFQRISPFIRRHRKVLDLTGSYLALIDHCRRMRTRWGTMTGLPDRDRGVMIDAYLQFGEDVARDVVFLADVIADGQIELNDAARLAKVDELAGRQAERNARVRHLSGVFERAADFQHRKNRELLQLQNRLP